MAEDPTGKLRSRGIFFAIGGLVTALVIERQMAKDIDSGRFSVQAQVDQAIADEKPTAVPENPDYLKTRNQFEDLFRSQLDNLNKIQDHSSGYPVAFIEEPGRSWRLSSLEANIQTAYFSPKLIGYDPHALAGAFILMPDGIRIKAERERTVIWTQRPNGLETIAKDFDMSKADAERQVQDVREVLYSKLNKK